ncbi:unnamed protein product [Oikopleura dioica]|uniref:Gla domain-containing protein n=1 Tax=Oikopleura dioica TaxID=34765 RepID=E4YG61_OIKDI|nr:unnamed protein product [Oikopleura dioica]
MKLFGSLALVAGASALAVSKETASEFLRVRRANSRFEEWKAGNLERECIEETCDATEFHEVYDNMAVSGPLLRKYFDCKNYIPVGLSGSAKTTAIRDCFNAGPSNQLPEIDQFPERPPSVPQDQVILLPNNGWATVEDSKWILALKHPEIGAGPNTEIHVNSVHCKMRAQQNMMLGGTNTHDCKINYEANGRYCRAMVSFQSCRGCQYVQYSPEHHESLGCS